MFTNLLVPLDGSDLAEAALPAALELAQKFDSQINLIMIVAHLPHEPLGVEDEAHDQILDHLRGHQFEEATRIMERYETELKKQHPHVRSQVVEGGATDKAILATADELEADSIVMSTHGRGGVSRLLFGSVAEKVMRQANIPVVLIRGKTL
jgi:nucleotide-binding universal stress UspA family protein